jgi:hypothetical protein
MWRKNRRRVDPKSGSRCVGVDINRNFNVLWDFRRHFAADSGVSASTRSLRPSSLLSALPRNQKPKPAMLSHYLDRYPGTRWFADVHSHVPAIFYNWGFDEKSTTDPSMNFLNDEFDGLRGRVDRAYRGVYPGG